MKWLSTLFLLVAVSCQAAHYYGMYSVGWLGVSWRYFNTFTLDPILFLSVLGLVVVYIASLLLRASNRWCATMLCGFILSLCVQLYILPPPPHLVVFGLRDHVLAVDSPDALRLFAREFHQAIPYLAISRGAVDSLDDKQSAAYHQLKQNYPFLGWSLDPGEGPTVFERDGRLNVEWSGTAVGKWGFSISLNRATNVPDKGPNAEILPAAADIFFYRAE